MNYIRIDDCDFNNGEGLRVVLWVSGCVHACEGCHNPQTHDFNAGKEFSLKDRDYLFSLLDSDYINGLSISGGDPLAGRNYQTILELCKMVKKKYPHKDIWIWTGYTIQELKKTNKFEIAEYSDVIIDGKYIKELDCSKNKGYAGSSNQNVYKTEDLLG
jgi:anaerobic ribonucleoside-triphosphate reductase activating protein